MVKIQNSHIQNVGNKVVQIYEYYRNFWEKYWNILCMFSNKYKNIIEFLLHKYKNIIKKIFCINIGILHEFKKKYEYLTTVLPKF